MPSLPFTVCAPIAGCCHGVCNIRRQGVLHDCHQFSCVNNLLDLFCGYIRQICQTSYQFWNLSEIRSRILQNIDQEVAQNYNRAAGRLIFLITINHGPPTIKKKKNYIFLINIFVSCQWVVYTN